MQTRLLVHQSACTVLVIAIGEDKYMWVNLGDVTDEKESTLKFLEKVKICQMQEGRHRALLQKNIFVMIARLECILLRQM